MKLRKTSTGWRDLHTIPLEGLTTMPASAQEWKVAKCQLGRKGSQVAGRSDDGKEDFFHGKHRGWSWVLVLGLLPSSLGQRHGGQLIRDFPLGKKKKKGNYHRPNPHPCCSLPGPLWLWAISRSWTHVLYLPCPHFLFLQVPVKFCPRPLQSECKLVHESRRILKNVCELQNCLQVLSHFLIKC